MNVKQKSRHKYTNYFKIMKSVKNNTIGIEMPVRFQRISIMNEVNIKNYGYRKADNFAVFC